MKHSGVEKTKSEKLTFTPSNQGMVDEVDKLLGMIFGAIVFFFFSLGEEWLSNFTGFLFGFLHPFKEDDRMTISATNAETGWGRKNRK